MFWIEKDSMTFHNLKRLTSPSLFDAHSVTLYNIINFVEYYISIFETFLIEYSLNHFESLNISHVKSIASDIYNVEIQIHPLAHLHDNCRINIELGQLSIIF